ncbi:MAG: flagellar filament capping protein FliD [Lachnospiraceae bacterium]|nr:flagellar filament capping protein FliD [Lachnospiraceae bacterium]
MSDRMRLSGINSGMDTQSIVEQLVTAKSTKKEKLEKEKTKLGWKQDSWKTLNSKLFSLYNEQFGTLRLQGSFKTKKASIVDSSIASVTADSGAVNGTQTLAVKQLSKTNYLTGKKLDDSVTSSTSVTDVVGDDGFMQSFDNGEKVTAFKVYKNQDDTTGTDIFIDSSMTMETIAKQFANAGLNASYDSNSHRFFISSQTEGDDGNFRITSNGEEVFPADDVTDDVKESAGYKMLDALGITAEAAGTGYIKGQNAIIELNGAEFESSTNLFQINGINITATQVSDKDSNGDYITTNVSVATDVDGIYDMIKSFFTKYNEIITEMDTLYNADSSKGYEPLTSDEKDAMSEDEIEEWEKKIKDSLLRRDDNLGTLISTLKDTMSSVYTLSDGSKYSLASFGINTLSYFEADENERGVYHINGDSDDDKTKGNEDVLKSMLTNNMDETMEFFNTLAKSAYDKLGKLMTREEGYRSFQSLYDDKLLQTEYDKLTDDIEAEEEYLSDYEDKWYDKFAAMEKAMEKVNSKSSALAGLLGSY